MFKWTDENIRTLCRLWTTTKAIEIAEVLGTTRCSVIGKADRLGLPSKVKGLERRLNVPRKFLFEDIPSTAEPVKSFKDHAPVMLAYYKEKGIGQ